MFQKLVRALSVALENGIFWSRISKCKLDREIHGMTTTPRLDFLFAKLFGNSVKKLQKLIDFIFQRIFVSTLGIKNYERTVVPQDTITLIPPQLALVVSYLGFGLLYWLFQKGCTEMPSAKIL